MARDEQADTTRLDKIRLRRHAWAHHQLGMRQEAVDDCEKLVALDPNDPSSYVWLGYYCEENGDVERAADYYRYLIRHFPRYHGSYTNLGYYFEVLKKRPDKAMGYYRKALRLNPRDFWALNNMGHVFQKKGAWGKAVLYYRRAFAVGVKEADKEGVEHITHNLAWAYYRCGKYEKARRLYRRLTKEEPDNAPVHADLGCVAHRMGDHENALASFEKASCLSPASRHYRRLVQIAL